MKIDVVKVGYLETNVYILSKDGHTLIIDPGDEPEKIIKKVNGKVDGIIITHHHFDHIGALDDIEEKYVDATEKDGINYIECIDINRSFDDDYMLNRITKDIEPEM